VARGDFGSEHISKELDLGTGGHAYIKAAWDEEPKFASDGRATKAELNADLERFSRSPRWMESWMNEIE
jgi:hypothetical protein